MHCCVTCMNCRKSGLVPKQKEEALGFTLHSWTQGVYFPDVTVVLRTETEVIAGSITSPRENTSRLH